MPRQIKVDFHCHTSASKDGHTRLDDLLAICDLRGIQRLAITDHNTITTALEGAARWPTRIIPGLEIMTSCGELIAYYVHEPVEQGLDPLETIRLLKAQGAVISVSHPFDIFRNGGWKLSWLEKVLPYLDAVEVFNAHCITSLPNWRAQAFARRNKLAGTAGSDAHDTLEIGMAGLILPDFNDAHGLREALLNASRFGKRTSLRVRLANSLMRTRK